MKGDLADLHEVRDKQGETLYRLFVLWHRKERRVVIIDGRAKANRTKLSETEYEAVQARLDLSGMALAEPLDQALHAVQIPSG